jgi:hypothetical protein
MKFAQAGVMLLGAALFLILLWPFKNILDKEPGPIVAGIVIWNVALVVVTILSIVDSFRKIRAGDIRDLATGVLIVKLAAIPFFLLNFYFLGALAGFGLFFGILPGLVVMAIAVPITWLAMISTSVYGWATIIAMRRERRIRPALVVVYSIFLAIFVADIAVGIELFARSRRRPGLGILIVLLIVGTLVLLLGIMVAIPGFRVRGLEWLGVIGVGMILATIVVAILVHRSPLGRPVRDSRLAAGVVPDDASGRLTGRSAEESSRQSRE